MYVLLVEGIGIDLELIKEFFLPLDMVVHQLKLQVSDCLEFLP